jgi:hypothetical protein
VTGSKSAVSVDSACSDSRALTPRNILLVPDNFCFLRDENDTGRSLLLLKNRDAQAGTRGCYSIVGAEKGKKKTVPCPTPKATTSFPGREHGKRAGATGAIGREGGQLAVKKRRTKCPHNREKRMCKPCGGSSICEHNWVRYIQVQTMRKLELLRGGKKMQAMLRAQPPKKRVQALQSLILPPSLFLSLSPSLPPSNTPPLSTSLPPSPAPLDVALCKKSFFAF